VTDFTQAYISPSHIAISNSSISQHRRKHAAMKKSLNNFARKRMNWCMLKIDAMANTSGPNAICAKLRLRRTIIPAGLE
jgi:hypothetical protein